MGRFKTPAPAPPTTPYSRTPMRQPTTTPRATSVRSTRVPSNTVNQTSSLSLLAAFDELCRNGSVLQEHSDKQLISHIQASGEWRKKYKSAEAEEKRLNSIIFQKDRELTAFEQRIRQARKFVEEEVKTMPCTVSVKYIEIVSGNCVIYSLLYFSKKPEEKRSMIGMSFKVSCKLSKIYFLLTVERQSIMKLSIV